MRFHLLYILLLTNVGFISAQIFDVETIKTSGDDDKRINLVILSEGYQTNELDLFITDATSFSNKMFSESPFKEYAEYFNVYAIKVPSNQSGADHPGTATDVTEPFSPILNVDTYFNATYDAYGNHRLLYYEIDGNNANNTEAKINTVLANNFPTYDQALILVNSSEYGGSGGEFPMTYTGFWGAKVAIHELGHSLFNLKDEYYPGDILAAEAINMTQQSDSNLVKWKNWVNTNNIGVYQYTCTTGNCADWYKPHENCIMEKIDKTFCYVCQEGIIEKIHSLVSPIDSYLPVSTSINTSTYPIDFQLNLIKPFPNTLESEWTLNASNFANNVDDISIIETDLNTGTNNLTAIVNDASPLLKVDNHETVHVYSVTWTITKSALGIEDITSNENSFEITLYPNPSNNIVNLKVESKNVVNLKADIISLDGKKIKSTKISSYETNEVDISHLSQGIYIANFYSNNILLTSKRFVKN